MTALQPKMKFFLENFLPVYPEGYQISIEDIRARTSLMVAEGESVYKVEDRSIEGLESTLPIRIYTPAAGGPFPIVVYFHGGGFVYGDLDTHDAICRALTNASDHIVVAVDYRLAPEHPFPAAPNDCYTAAKWVYEHAAELNGDANRLSLVGDSAGGNLSTVVSLMAKEKGELEIAKQILMYPTVDLGATHKYPSYEENGEGYFLTKETIDVFRGAYIHDERLTYHPYVAPMNVADHSGLPPTMIITAGFDPLRDEGEVYGEKLKQAGVEVDIRHEAGLIHGFFNLFSIMKSNEDIDYIYKYMGEFLNK
ncbi:alpha/beta hydrolase [Lysinibacillus sp. LZ02]|uniref:alpha/beta hydrolase n=1 Tax=Lysinibacillus sp. LZ02 TaxID=3420668 RepID=UPI003D35B10D